MAEQNMHRHGELDSAAESGARHEGHERHQGHGEGKKGSNESHGSHQEGDHHAHMVVDFRRRFWISLLDLSYAGDVFVDDENTLESESYLLANLAGGVQKRGRQMAPGAFFRGGKPSGRMLQQQREDQCERRPVFRTRTGPQRV